MLDGGAGSAGGPGGDGGRSRLPSGLADVFWRAPFNRLPGGDPRPRHQTAPPPSDPAAHDGSLAERVHARLQEIDHPRPGKKTSVAEIPPDRFAMAVMEIVAGEHDADVARFITHLKESRSPLYPPLHAAWATAQNDLGRFRVGVADWFDGEMQRLTRLYRRQSRWVLAVVAIVVTLLMSADALEYGGALARDDAFSRQVLAAAGNQAELDRLDRACGQGGNPTGEAPSESSDATQGDHDCIYQVLAFPAFVRIFQHSLVRLELAAGRKATVEFDLAGYAGRLRPGHVAGFALTVVALLFGAPFWFDAAPSQRRQVPRQHPRRRLTPLCVDHEHKFLLDGVSTRLSS